jgi:hypothetical protein
MVITRLTGGLGNQLFQYAAARSLSEASGQPLTLDISYFGGRDIRKFALEPFDLPGRLWRHGIPPYRARQIKLIDSAAAAIAARARVLREAQYEYYGDLATAGGKTYLIGHWQSPKYFSDIQAQLRTAVSAVQLGGPAQNIEQRLSTSNSVAIHVRRGDYVVDLKAAERLGTLGLDYYERAFAEIRANIDDAAFFVFSDDIEWCKANLDLPGADFITETSSPHEDLILMSRARHNVIANSSFSWWGAWLGAPEGRIVISPSRWFAGLNQSTDDLIPDSWLRL